MVVWSNDGSGAMDLSVGRGEGKKAVVWRGVFFMCRDVRSGFGFGGCGETWWR